jgi:DNA (cytosine-5)-methyltransferase 1
VSEHSILKIVDYGERGFKGVKIETIGVIINTKMKGVNNRVIIESYVNKTIIYKDQNYICSKNYPYWLIYRDNFFDTIASKLHFDVFAAYRDRQITKRITSDVGRVRVLKSRNIGNNKIIDIPKYDAFVDDYSRLSISKFINNDKAILVPNLTYNPRACFLPGNAIVDGSVAVLLPKKEIQITESDLDYYNSEEFVNFYRIVRNFGTRSLNIDSNAVYFFGLMSVI